MKNITILYNILKYLRYNYYKILYLIDAHFVRILNFFILAEKVRSEGLSVLCVPTSFQARQLILENKLKLTDLESHPQVIVILFNISNFFKLWFVV